MENNFNNRDFEQFVKQNADQYRMFPSEKVWKGIHSTLHTRRWWLGIGLALLLLSTGTVTWIMLSPGKKQEILTSLPPIPVTPTKNHTADQKKTDIIISPVRSNSNNNKVFIASPDNLQKNLFLAEQNPSPEINIKNETSLVSQHVTEPIITPVTIIQPDLNNKPSSPSKVIVAARPTANFNLAAKTKFDDIPALEKKQTEIAFPENRSFENKLNSPFTIESVLNSYKYIHKRKKLSLEVYVAPTISYRKLEENTGFLNSTRSRSVSSNYLPIANINSVVTHKPDIGLELGFTTGYPLTKSLTILAGLQFNVSKYDIRAYSSTSEVATIALNSGGGSNSVSTMTNYRNFNGTETSWLHNLYISASAPVGAELKLTGNKKTYIGIGSTIQPTYILTDRAYLISTDYKNYVEVPSLIRRWNLNSSFEIFAGYSTGKIKWKVGPQVRYQVFSSFQEKYPVKEHLFDFGLKVGVMLNK